MSSKKEIAVRALYAINRVLERDEMTQTALAKQLESKPSRFTEILKGRMYVPTEMMSLLCERFGVCAEWLLTGEGDMLSQVSVDDTPMPLDSDIKHIPLLPFSAAAGYMAGGNDVTAFRQESIAFADFTARGADCAIRVDGNSMYPRYSNGDILAIRIIKEPTFFQWGKVYVLSTNQGCVVKRLFPDPDHNDRLVCHSENCVDYPDYSIEKADVLAVAIVVGHAGVE